MASGQQQLPPTLTDAQGREFRLQHDPVSGHPQYRHTSGQRDQAGNTLTVEIVIDLAPDGSFTRRTSQALDLVGGDRRHEVVTSSHGPDGTQLRELAESTRVQGRAVTTERTVGTYAAGQLVRREAHVEQSDEATDAKTRETTRVHTRIHGVWDAAGEPITDATVPVVDRTDTQSIRSPGQGINKDTDRSLTFTRHAHGPAGALDWDEHGSLVVRFEGRRGQYIERELRVPLDPADGAPEMSRAEVTRTDDRQNLLAKGLMQARIWGGLTSNLSWIIGINFARGSAFKGLLAVSAASAGAQLIGEGHAVATRRNDGDWGRVAVSAYDMLLTGMLAAHMYRRRGLGSLTTGQQAGLTALGGTGLGMHGAQLLGGVSPIGSQKLGNGLGDAGIGRSMLPAAAAGTSDGAWRAQPRFDAAAALLG